MATSEKDIDMGAALQLTVLASFLIIAQLTKLAFLIIKLVVKTVKFLVLYSLTKLGAIQTTPTNTTAR